VSSFPRRNARQIGFRNSVRRPCNPSPSPRFAVERQAADAGLGPVPDCRFVPTAILLVAKPARAKLFIRGRHVNRFDRSSSFGIASRRGRFLDAHRTAGRRPRFDARTMLAPLLGLVSAPHVPHFHRPVSAGSARAIDAMNTIATIGADV
jgi:hypothetical protein